jgi:hypothetical protein
MRLSPPEPGHNFDLAPLLLYQPENSAFGEEIGTAGIAGNSARPFISDERNCVLDPGSNVIHQRHKIGNRAEVNIRRVIPGMAE